MHVISYSRLKQFWRNHPSAEVSLRYWYKLTTKQQWQSFNDICQTFPSADRVKNFVIFNIGGNNFRLIAYVDYQQSKVFIRFILTHAEYDKEDWKKDQWYQ
jgi:mRNA interferase HigB